MDHEFVLILDFGGQYNQLIARRVRECSVYCEVKPYNKITLDEIKALSPKGIIFTGGPQSVYGDGAPSVDKGIFELGVPVLGICSAVRCRPASRANTARQKRSSTAPASCSGSTDWETKTPSG